MFYFSTDGYRRPLSEYGTYRPSLKATKEKLQVALCLHTSDDCSPSGIFRIATAGTNSIHVPFDIPTLLGQDLLPNQKFELVVSPESIKFKESKVFKFLFNLNYLFIGFCSKLEFFRL